MFDPVSHYRQHTTITLPGRFVAALEPLPDDVDGLIGAVQNLLVHYQTDKAKLSPDIIAARGAEVDLRWAEAMLNRLMQLQDGNLLLPREPAKRLLCTCRDFAVLLCTFMRYKQIPSRVRYGFAHDQYKPERPIHDHVLVEYWDGQHWRYAESRLYALPEPIQDIDQKDFPRDLFFSGGETWRLIRAGNLSERAFSGYHFDDDYGQWIVRNLFLFDMASLCGYEPLMWDAWGVLLEEKPGTRVMNVDQLALLDRQAQFDVCDRADCASLRTALLSCSELYYLHDVHSFSPVKGTYRVNIHRNEGE
ncbi:transglutaminase domain-containing protein [Providencia sp. PROV130]|uniref:transglutaminase domain-containing protein n=1 Tax=Providencia sp. PROV130 TaxID=2949840 RepID=UPI002349B1BF|nr:transglutaminase domain-containing protein [Providencia sp. PROV130]